MYAQFFGLSQEPFSIAPDPRFLFMSERHREALAHLLYGVRGGGGFVLLTGEIGAGKTTVCRLLLEQVPKRCNVAYIFNPKLTVEELLKSVCDEFGIPYAHPGPGAATVKDYLDPLNRFLLQTHAVGQSNVLIIDEAQNLSADVLEQLRLLTNLETNERKLLQIVLIGQPELRQMLARPELEQLAQRVIARYHLEALTETETLQYIRHRLTISGLNRALPFDRESVQRIHQLSRGVPRRINLLCDRALLGAYSIGAHRVRREIVDKAAREVFETPSPMNPRGWLQRRPAVLGLGLVGGAALFAAGSWMLGGGLGSPGRAAASTTAASAPAVAASAKPPQAVAASAAAAAPPPASAASVALAATPAPQALAAAELPVQFKTLVRDPNEALRELAPAWKLNLADDGDPCLLAPAQQVHCHAGRSNLALVRLLGRPGIVSLSDASGQPVYAQLTGLTAQSATLRMGGVAQTITLGSFTRLWRGDFMTLWRVPPGYTVAAAGKAAVPADWLAARLATAAGEASPGEASVAALKPRIAAFQATQGLAPDGLAGPITLMQLNRATGVDEPRLQTE
ncbi:ExeA family protein [Methylibium sp. Root1272]|uniref:ExeA family protein n=1 Tax=Methylibium sp. Root1272 TaxID=1736441 RepID=UPI0006FA5D3B|nr:AAA family ATPase [Methylibium sp. Root1272]KQW73814.1 peptidoglycan-binding protein [Methylibium sp. Root1272]